MKPEGLQKQDFDSAWRNLYSLSEPDGEFVEMGYSREFEGVPMPQESDRIRLRPDLPRRIILIIPFGG